MVGKDVTVKSGPLKTILRRVARQHIDRVYPKNGSEPGCANRHHYGFHHSQVSIWDLTSTRNRFAPKLR